MWFFLALLGYIALAIVLVLDKFILTKSVEKPVVYTFYSTIFLFAVLLAWPFGVELLQGIDWFWALLSGLGFGFGLWTMFIAVKQEEASRINPFIGAVITVVTFASASLFLGETLTPFQMVGMAVLILSSILFVASQDGRKKHTGIWCSAFTWAIVSGILFAISHTTAKYIYDIYPFLTGFVWTRATTGFVGLVALLYPSVRKTLKRKKADSVALKKCKDSGFGEKYAVGIVITDKILGVIAVILIQYAIAIGSVTMVNAMVGLQYAIMFLIIYLLSRFAPKVFKEEFTHKEIVFESIAIALVVIGSAFFVL